MKQCPKCGYVDPPWWRQGAKPRIEYDVCHIDDLRFNDPEFAERLEKEKEIVDEYNAYRLYESGWVRRRWRPVWEVQRWEVTPRELIDGRTGLPHKPRALGVRSSVRAGPILNSAALPNTRELVRIAMGRFK